jgi:phosphoglycerol transferase
MRVRPLWWEPFWSALVSAILSMVVFLPIISRWSSGWAPGDMLSTYNNSQHWTPLGYSVTDQAGFPSGMDLNLFPGVDITQNAFARLVSFFTDSPFLGINLLLILSFPLTAALAAVALRLVGLRGMWAISLAVAYSTIPFHFGRALGHAYLSTMYAAVSGVILALLIGNGRWGNSRPARLGTWSAVGLLVVVTAWSGIYYAAFGLILTSAAVLWRFVHGSSRRETIWNLIPVAMIAGVAMIGLLPAVSARVHENVGGLGDRPAYESVALAGSLAMALLPAPLSVLPRMGYVNEAILGVIRDSPFSEATQVPNFGTWITTACLLFAAAWCVVSLRRGSTWPRDISFLVFLVIIVVLFFIPWGLNIIFAEFITAQIRAWNRLLPVLLLLFVLLGAAALARTSFVNRPRVAIVGPSLILLVVLVEQVIPFRQLYLDNAARYGRVTDWSFTYAADVNRAIPQTCGVVQLPYMVYPENGTAPPRLNDYEHFWQSLTNRDKKWTYGAVRGSESAERAEGLARAAESGDLVRLAKSGVCGIHVDLRGYSRDESKELTTRLSERSGPPIAIGHDGQWLFYRVAAPT